MKKKFDDIEFTFKWVGIENTWIGKRNKYNVVLKNKNKQRTTFVFHDSVVNFEKPIYHDDLFMMSIHHIYNLYMNGRRGVKTYGFLKVVNQDFINQIKILKKLSK